MRIAVFATCLADGLFPTAAIATVELLERLGHEVVFPDRQTCCGQMHVNTGYLREALPLVRHHVDVFESSAFDAVVAPSGSCVGSARHQHAMVARRAGDEALAARAEAVAARTYELSEFLDPNASLPCASTLCGACFDACPVRIDIPSILVHLRAEQVDAARGGIPGVQDVAMTAASWVMRSPKLFGLVEKAVGVGLLAGWLTPWADSRDLPKAPRTTFRQWWAHTRGTP